MTPTDGEFDDLVTDDEREMFDELLDEVMSELPEPIHALLEEVPLVVEDYPDDAVLEEMGIEDPGELCGLHSGIPLTQRSVMQSGDLPETIHIYRDGILNQSTDRKGVVTPGRLKRQIRITVLHEIGHHFGLDEDELAKLGYA
jgi:predicted Zn-dependent protease with MMP-like domain